MLSRRKISIQGRENTISHTRIKCSARQHGNSDLHCQSFSEALPKWWVILFPSPSFGFITTSTILLLHFVPGRFLGFWISVNIHFGNFRWVVMFVLCLLFLGISRFGITSLIFHFPHVILPIRDEKKVVIVQMVVVSSWSYHIWPWNLAAFQEGRQGKLISMTSNFLCRY